MWWLDLQLHMQSVPMTTKVASSNLAHGEVYSIQHCHKVCQYLTAGLWFSSGTLVCSTNKTVRHDSYIWNNAEIGVNPPLSIPLTREYITYIFCQFISLIMLMLEFHCQYFCQSGLWPFRICPICSYVTLDLSKWIQLIVFVPVLFWKPHR